MKRSMDPTQKAFGVSLFNVQLIAKVSTAQLANRLSKGPLRVTSLRTPELVSAGLRPSRTLVTPQINPDWRLPRGLMT